jgi:hypothetical protein
LAIALDIETFLERHHGAEIRDLAARGAGFGIVAGTGTGKTLAIRPIAETILRVPLRVGVVNREREATPETPTWNVVIVTTGIARRWFQDGDILARDTLIVDEIHQTSAELELCLALGKRAGSRFIWLSATVDPTFYARYLGSQAVVESHAFDPAKAAEVKVVRRDATEFLDDRFLRTVTRERRGVGVFLPTRAGVEEAAKDVAARFPRLNVAFYHGGEPIRVLRPFLEGGERKPYLLAMTAAGQSALNVHGLDTVVIDDTRFANVIEHGRNVLTRVHLGANEILQMAGRVHGRVAGGRVFILSDRDLQFAALRPTAPEFQLAGDSERVALTCASLGVRADELDLPVPLDKRAYRDAIEQLERRGIMDGGRLSAYGKAVEALPVDRPWAELIVHADDGLMPYLAVMSSIDSLFRMTRDDRDLSGMLVPGSDHLTAYNLYAEAYTRAGYLGEVYGLARHLFDDRIDAWAERRGVLVKAIEDAALAMASVYRSVGLPLPASMPHAGDPVLRAFTELLARYLPFDLVIDGETARGDDARVSKTSVCGSWGAIAGDLRYFADRFGTPRASIEGTQLPMDLVRRHATRTEPRVVYDPAQGRSPLIVERRVEYFGFELACEGEPLETFPADLAPAARHALADALARGVARHPAVRRHQAAIEQLRDIHRRSAGVTASLGLAELTALYERPLEGVTSMDAFRAHPLRLDLESLVSPEDRARYLALPSVVEIGGRPVEILYDIEDDGGTPFGVARLRVPEKIARTLVDAELPRLDRPLRFMVTRGVRGAVRASTLEELQDALDRPWTDDEVNREQRSARGAVPGRGRGPAGHRGGGGRDSRGAGGRGRRGRR